MSFSCSCDDRPEFFSQEIRRARVPHKCCECGHVIAPGETYSSDAGKWEGEFCTYKLCERCDDLRLSFSDLGYCVTYGDLFWDYDDWLDDGGKRAYELQKCHREWAEEVA